MQCNPLAAKTNRIKINKDNIVWAIARAGFIVDEFTERNPSVREWIEGTKDPTIKQQEKFARQVSFPFGYLFLQNPPTASLTFPVFRGAAGVDDSFRLNVYDTVLNIQSRHEWLEEYLNVNDIDNCDLVESISNKTPVSEAVNTLRARLGLDQRWAFSLASVDAAVSVLTERMEETNIFIAFNGVVGN